MGWLAARVVRRGVAAAIVLAVLVLAALSLLFAARVEQDDDLLAFLPPDNAEVRSFHEVNGRFGGLDIALVGIEAPDVLAPDFLDRLGRVTRDLEQTEGVQHAMSLTSVEDFAPDPERGGIRVDYLVAGVPRTPADAAALRERVMSRDHIVGQLVSADGRAALIYCFGAHGADPRETAGRIRAIVEAGFPTEIKRWGGAPFISTYIYDVTQQDLARLGPWAVLAIVLLTLASFRDVIGTAVALLSTGIAIAIAVGAMGALSVKSNIVLGSMPVLLFALGSAYPIHVLSRYHALAPGLGCERGLAATLAQVGPTVLASGLTTVAGLASFLAMDIRPLRTFGVFTGVGIVAALVLSLTFVPAVIRLAELRGKLAPAAPSRIVAALVGLARRRRRALGVVLGAVTLLSMLLVGRVEARMDNAAFFSEGSPPALSEAFLRERFGGSQFLQVEVKGDLTDPHVLRAVQAAADRIARLPGVSSVSHVPAVIAQINAAMTGEQRVPDSAEKVKLLYAFLAGKRAVAQLVDDDRSHALLQVKIADAGPAELEALLSRIRAIQVEQLEPAVVLASADGPRGDEVQARLRALVIGRVRAIAHAHGVQVPASDEALDRRLSAEPDVEAARARVVELVAAHLGSDESSAELPVEPPDAARRVAAAVAILGPAAATERVASAVATALGTPTDEAATEVAGALARPLAEAWRRALAGASAQQLVTEERLVLPEGARRARLLSALADALTEQADPAALVPAPPGAVARPRLETRITGLVLLHQGLSRSVASNQLRSFALSLGLVLLIMAVHYRSFTSGLLATSPIALTLALTYGGMGLAGVHLDIGTSMLASLIVGAGVDYAVHFLAAWRAPADLPNGSADLDGAAALAAAESGPPIAINAVVVAAGFFVLTLGEARPLENVGGLTASALLVAALATFLVLPVLARRRAYPAAGRIIRAADPSDPVRGVIAASRHSSPSRPPDPEVP